MEYEKNGILEYFKSLEIESSIDKDHLCYIKPTAIILAEEKKGKIKFITLPQQGVKKKKKFLADCVYGHEREIYEGGKRKSLRLNICLQLRCSSLDLLQTRWQ